MAFNSSKFESFIDVVRLMQQGFNAFLEQKGYGYRQHVTSMQKEYSLNFQTGNSVLLIYKLSKRQQGSKKKLFQEQTFLRPINTGGLMQQPSGTGYTQQYKYWVDDLISFEFYHIEYEKQQAQQEHFIEYGSLLTIIPDSVFVKSNIMVPLFWSQDEDQIVDIKDTKVYKCQLKYQVQTEQELIEDIDAIRSISINLEYLAGNP